LVEFRPNPHHRRAHHVVLTAKGQQTYDAAIRAFNPRVNALAGDLRLKDIKAAHSVMLALRQKLEGENDAGNHDKEP
jgi:DNA-binding MarR family transcriptional regulator